MNMNELFFTNFLLLSYAFCLQDAGRSCCGKAFSSGPYIPGVKINFVMCHLQIICKALDKIIEIMKILGTRMNYAVL
jgi:hypothetical protein